MSFALLSLFSPHQRLTLPRGHVSFAVVLSPESDHHHLSANTVLIVPQHKVKDRILLLVLFLVELELNTSPEALGLSDVRHRAVRLPTSLPI